MHDEPLTVMKILHFTVESFQDEFRYSNKSVYLKHIKVMLDLRF